MTTFHEQNMPRILIADDTLANIRVLGTILKRERYQINVAKNGQQAVSIAMKTIPDLILMDIMMPEMDGLEACRRIKAEPSLEDIPIIFLSAKSEDEDIIQGFELGAADYVTKPFKPKILLARVKTHIALRQKTQDLKAFAHRDGLTLLANRRCFDEFLLQEWLRCLRMNCPLSLVMVDIDYFKLYNDTYGHLQGDETLKKVAQAIAKIGDSSNDLAARFGGEEFSSIYGGSNLEAGIQFAQKICNDIEALQIPHSNSKISDVVTTSVGVACLIPEDPNSYLNLIKIADEKLYVAKTSGRNQIKY
jgi:diguanylate cyclase (GGDEF)-like protein